MGHPTDICKRGHEMTEDNTYRGACRECRAITRKRYLESEKGKAAKQRYKDKYRDRAVAQTNKRVVENRARIHAIKENAQCADCGGSFHPAAMDFDHVEGEKVNNVSQMLGGTWERIEAEIAKCEIVCSNCHRVRTYSRIHDE